MVEKYSTRVRQAISDKYLEYSKGRATLEKMREKMIERLKNEEKTLSYVDYISLQEKVRQTTKNIEEMKIQIDIWDKAREICLNVADEIL